MTIKSNKAFSLIGLATRAVSYTHLYRPIEKQKEFSGILTAYDENSVTIEEDGALRTFDKKEIALIRLKIEF